MAYRLKRDESVIRGLKRVVREEMESAGTQLSSDKKAQAETPGPQKTGRDEGIHEARKSIKKVRALLRLVSPEPGDAYARENGRLRDIARKLSELRDAFAIIATFDDLKKKYKDQTRNKLRSVRAGLEKKRNEAGGDEEVGVVLDRAAGALTKGAKRVKTWPLHTNGFGAIRSGLEETYREGRAALARARKDQSPASFHTLRKRVKDHWYHIRLLEGLWSDMMGAYETSLENLQDWLGNDHNLAVLRQRIVAEPEYYGKPKDIELTLELVDKYQKELRDQAMALAERVYDDNPRDFTRRVKRLWDTWRHEPEPSEEPSAAV